MTVQPSSEGSGRPPCSAQSTVVEEGILGLLEERSFSALRQRRPSLSNTGREDCVRQVGAKVSPCLPLLRSGVPRTSTGNTSSLREIGTSVSTHYALYTFCVRCSRAQFQQRIEGSLNPARPASTFAFGLPLSEEDTPPCCSQARVTPRRDWVYGAMCCVGIPRSGGACTCACTSLMVSRVRRWELLPPGQHAWLL
jgi:hypothetical protein